VNEKKRRSNKETTLTKNLKPPSLFTSSKKKINLSLDAPDEHAAPARCCRCC
jgi:hypothetical protein